MYHSFDKEVITPQSLARIPFFQNLKMEYIELLSEKINLCKLKEGTLIISEGDTTQKMYFIISGMVNVYRRTYKGKDETICTLSAPTYFGEMSIIDGGPRSASVAAKTDVVLAELKWEDMRYLFDDKPEIMSYIFKNIASTLSLRLRRLNGLYSHQTHDLA